MQFERVFIGVHVVEAHELESVGFDHLAAEDVHAVLPHQCERAFRIDILLVIPSHVVDGRRESSQRLERRSDTILLRQDVGSAVRMKPSTFSASGNVKRIAGCPSLEEGHIGRGGCG
jgi:hypothetical protein